MRCIRITSQEQLTYIVAGKNENVRKEELPWLGQAEHVAVPAEGCWPGGPHEAKTFHPPFLLYRLPWSWEDAEPMASSRVSLSGPTSL